MGDVSGSTRILAGLAGIRADLESFYKDLHAHPELSHREERTGGEVAERLRAWGYEVHDGIGGTGAAGVMANGDGPVVLFRADMDALPVEERTGLPYASTVTAADADGVEQPVMHACGHDMHVTCALGAARLMAEARDAWKGTYIALFQPAEETGDGAEAMVRDGLADRIPRPDVCLGQHVFPYPAGTVYTREGKTFASADNYRVTIHGKGIHGSRPSAGIDPIVIAAAVVLRLQTIVSRELDMLTPAVVTVGSLHAGSSPNVIPDSAVMQINVRTYDDDTRTHIREAIERIAKAECAAARAPKPPDVEHFGDFPLTSNDEATTRRVAAAFSDFFGDRAQTFGMATASEDFSYIPQAFDAPFTYWGFGGADPELWKSAVEKGTAIPENHSPDFAPAIQPTLDTGVQAAVVAATAWLG